jgi:hypothetical protein
MKRDFALVFQIFYLRSKGIGFRSLNEGAIDTTCASGELIFNIFSALAQFERRLIQERTKAGLAAARARGRHGGRPRVTAAEAKVVLAKKLNADKTLEIDDICKDAADFPVDILPLRADVTTRPNWGRFLASPEIVWVRGAICNHSIVTFHSMMFPSALDAHSISPLCEKPTFWHHTLAFAHGVATTCFVVTSMRRTSPHCALLSQLPTAMATTRPHGEYAQS